MFYFYLVLSALLTLLSDSFFSVLHQAYSWWLVPLLFLGYFIILALIQVLLLAVPALFVRFDSPHERGAQYFRVMAAATLPLLFRLARVRLCAGGLDKLPKNGRFLLVCNHQHDFDPAVILTLFPNVGLSFVAKKEIYTEKPLIARIMHKLHCIPLDRENNREAAKSILSAINLLKEDTASVCIFPEGYTSKTCELLPMRNGAFKIAIKAGVPIVVCVINNTRAVLPRLLRHRTDVQFKVLDVITPDRFADMSTSDISNTVSMQMQTALQQLRAVEG